MAKGSQLAQLKSALSNAGLSRQSQPKRGQKRKRTSVGESKDTQKKEAKLQKIIHELNPFDVKVTKLKHDVGGRKLKGVTGRPGLSKQIGLEQRKKTLLPEYEQRNKSGSFVDRRFGENDPTMAPEERMLERFTMERQRASKGAAFNLEDEQELTHYGHSLSAMDDFDDTGIGLSEEEEERGQIDRNTVRVGHFGGFNDEAEEQDDDEPPRKKSKAEVMAEVIAKSKEHKYMRQVEKERDEQLRQKVDADFDAIRGLLFAKPADPSSTGSNRIPLGLGRPAPLIPNDGADEPAAEPPARTEDEYDQYVRELAFDKRSKPTDRLKTEEELAQEEKDKLEKAERARRRRMRGEEGSGESDEEGEGGRRGKKRRRVAEADDLEDDLKIGEEDEGYGLGAGLGANGHVEAEDSSEGEETEEEDSDDEDAEEEESDIEADGLPEDFEGDESGEEAVPTTLVPSSTSRPDKGKGKGKPKELPFVFPCPTTHAEFLDIVDGVDDADVPTVVQRIRALYHPSLAEDNKLKLQTFLGVLLDHILYVASPPDSSFTLVTALFPHLKALTASYPIASAEAFVSKLVLMQKNLARGLARGPLLPDSKTFPGAAELALLRIIGLLWSTSDFSHPVVAPAFLLMGQYLAQARVRSTADIASGLFLCTLCLQYTALSHRLVPEAISFLNNAVLYLLPHGLDTRSLPGSFPSPDLESDAVIALGLTEKQLKNLPPSRPDLIALLDDSNGNAQAKVDLAGTAFTLITRSAQNLTSLEGFVELFEPTLALLERLSIAKFSSELQKRYSDTKESLTRMLKFAGQSRKPLRLQAHKPIPIATYVPKFDERSSYGRRHDPDSERNAASKLRAQYKQERKGAMRELRKDNRFLAAEKAKVRDEKDRAYKAKMARVEGEITVERHEEKQFEREKMKQKRRAGKR